MEYLNFISLFLFHISRRESYHPQAISQRRKYRESAQILELSGASGRAHIVRWTMVLRRPKRSVDLQRCASCNCMTRTSQQECQGILEFKIQKLLPHTAAICIQMNMVFHHILSSRHDKCSVSSRHFRHISHRHCSESAYTASF